MSEETTPAPADDAVPWLSGEQLRDWRSLVALFMTLPASLDAQLKRDAGVNSFEYHVLASLSMAPDRTRVISDLAVLAGGSLSRLSHAVTRLERDGWVERRSCTAPGRRVEVRLTERGWVKLVDVAPSHVREARRLVVDVLSPEQLVTLGEAARAITAACAEAPAADDGTTDGDAGTDGEGCG